MRVLYLDCSMGASGDMLISALVNLFDDQKKVLEELNNLNVPNINYKNKQVVSKGFALNKVSVLVGGVEECEHTHSHEHTHEHHYAHTHKNMHDIRHIVSDHIQVDYKVKQDILAVYDIIADAESKSHGVEVDKIHFHEVGQMDAIADITAVCYLINRLKIDKIIASEINMGSGFVKCAHGVVPVPAPATVHILKDVPIYCSDIESELCTPTGAALLKYFVKEYKKMPIMKVEKCSYGLGNKEFEVLNAIRAFLGEINNENIEQIYELSCNIDDMTPEEIAFAFKKLLKSGALDVYTTNIQMKKNRAGIKISALCREKNKQDVIKTFFKHTTTLGIRENVFTRYILDRKIVKADTPYGKLDKKESSGYGIQRYKYEFDDLAEIAKKMDSSILDIKKDL